MGKEEKKSGCSSASGHLFNKEGQVWEELEDLGSVRMQSLLKHQDLI